MANRPALVLMIYLNWRMTSVQNSAACVGIQHQSWPDSQFTIHSPIWIPCDPGSPHKISHVLIVCVALAPVQLLVFVFLVHFLDKISQVAVKEYTKNLLSHLEHSGPNHTTTLFRNQSFFTSRSKMDAYQCHLITQPLETKD